MPARAAYTVCTAYTACTAFSIWLIGSEYSIIVGDITAASDIIESDNKPQASQ